MPITEKGAKQRLCPFISTSNRSPCVASDCMAWRWWDLSSNVWHNAIETSDDGFFTEKSTPPDDESIQRAKKTLPKGNGWGEPKPIFDDDEGLWYLKWERRSDPDRKGNCTLMRDE